MIIISFVKLTFVCLFYLEIKELNKKLTIERGHNAELRNTQPVSGTLITFAVQVQYFGLN